MVATVSDEPVYAAPTYDRDGESVGRGSLGRRITLIEGDPRFSVLVRSIPTGCGSRIALASRSFTHIPIEVDEQRLLLNVSSAATRLHTTRDTIRDTVSDQGVEGLVRLANRVPLPAIVDNFGRIAESPFFTSTTTLLTNTEWEIRIQKRDLMRIVSEALQPGEPARVRMVRSSTTSAHYQTPIIRGLLSQGENRQLTLSVIGDELARGSFARVYRACQVNQPQLHLVYKEALEPESNAVIEDEVALLDAIHEQGRVQHIVERPLLYTRVAGHDGYLQRGYREDLVDLMNRADDRSLRAIRDYIACSVLRGVNSLRKRDLAYFDIKPENVLVGVPGNRALGTLALADLAGSYSYRNPPSWTFDGLLGTFTCPCITIYDLTALADLSEDLKLVTTVEEKAAHVRFWGEQRQVYALGTLLYRLFTHEAPVRMLDERGLALARLEMSNHRMPIEYITAPTRWFGPLSEERLRSGLVRSGLEPGDPRLEKIVEALHSFPERRCRFHELLEAFE